MENQYFSNFNNFNKNSAREKYQRKCVADINDVLASNSILLMADGDTNLRLPVVKNVTTPPPSLFQSKISEF